MNSLTYLSICDQYSNSDHPPHQQIRVELTSGNINSWWPDNRLFHLQQDLGEGTTPNHADVSDRVNQQLHLRVGDVVWCAHRPAMPEVSNFCWQSTHSVRSGVSCHATCSSLSIPPAVSRFAHPSITDPAHLTILLTSICPFSIGRFHSTGPIASETGQLGSTVW